MAQLIPFFRLSLVVYRLFALLVAGVLFFFTLRRWLFTIVALQGQRASNRDENRQNWPAVLWLTPLRNEAEALPALIKALQQVRYPADKLTVVFVDDGSTDQSAALIDDAFQSHPNWHRLSLPTNVGKASALNVALDTFPDGEIVAIYDADERPEPTARPCRPQRTP